MEDVKRWSPGRLIGPWAPPLLFAALIFYFSSRPGSGLPKIWLLQHDKLLHAGEYFVLAALLLRGLLLVGVRSHRAVIIAVALGAGYGLLDEWHQSFVAGRQGNDLGDLAADAIGSSLGAVAAWRATRRYPNLLSSTRSYA